MEKTSLSSVFKTCGHGLREVVVVVVEEGKGMLLVRSGGVVLVRSQTQLLWPIYPCHSSRGCGGGLDELARQSMKQREGEGVCMTGAGGGRGDG